MSFYNFFKCLSLVKYLTYLGIAVGNAKVYPENCSNDEGWKAIWVSRWPHHPLSGIVSGFSTHKYLWYL